MGGQDPAQKIPEKHTRRRPEDSQQYHGRILPVQDPDRAGINVVESKIGLDRREIRGVGSCSPQKEDHHRRPARGEQPVHYTAESAGDNSVPHLRLNGDLLAEEQEPQRHEDQHHGKKDPQSIQGRPSGKPHRQEGHDKASAEHRGHQAHHRVLPVFDGQVRSAEGGARVGDGGRQRIGWDHQRQQKDRHDPHAEPADPLYKGRKGVHCEAAQKNIDEFRLCHFHRSVSSHISGNGTTGFTSVSCGTRNFSIQHMSYQRPNLYPQRRKVPQSR